MPGPIARESGMAASAPVDDALKRLEASLDLLDSAVERRLESARDVSNIEGEVHQLSTDRSRLAQALDASEARAVRLEEANKEVSRRLVAAMEAIREVLARHNG